MHPIEPEELMAYLDGELSSGRAKTAATHLGECEECQAVLTELRSVSQTLKTWEVEPTESSTPPAIATDLVERVPKPRSVLPGYLLRWREILGPPWRTVGLATICLVVFSALWFRSDTSPRLFLRPESTVALIAPDQRPPLHQREEGEGTATNLRGTHICKDPRRQSTSIGYRRSLPSGGARLPPAP